MTEDDLKGKKILIIEDETHIAEGVAYNLKREGFEYKIATNGIEALELWKSYLPDLLILDLMLPMIDGFGVLDQVRNENKKIPILILSARNQTVDKMKGFKKGVDDYLTKPFNPKELLLRVLSILKRSKSEENIDNEIYFGDYTLNIEKRELTKSEDRVYLTDREMNLLIALAKSPGQPLNREKLAGIDEPGRSVDVGINRLRRKIEKDPRMPLWLQTVRGEGYILRPDK